MSQPERGCVLCGNDVRGEVAVAMVWWREPMAGRVCDSVPRCLDRAACRTRAERVDGSWLAADREEAHA